MEHTFVAGADGPRLVRVDARDDEDLVCYSVLELAQTQDVVDHRVFVVGGAGADDQEETVVLA